MAKLVEAELPHSTSCGEAAITEYWHEHDLCGDPMCYVQECETCGEWQTLCGMT